MEKEINTDNSQEFDFHQLSALVKMYQDQAVTTPEQVIEAFRSVVFKVWDTTGLVLKA